MKKRFTDCDRWDDPWYRSMSPSYKLLWEFILSKCDNAGVWKVDFSLARFMTNCEELTEEHALANFNEEKQRIHPFKKGYWFIPDFVGFQFGGFNGENNFHRQIRELLRNYGLIDFEGQTSPLQGALEKEKDKEQDKDKEKEIKGIVKGGFLKPTLEELEALFREKGFHAEAVKFFDYYEANGWRVGKNPMKKWRPAVANWLRNAKTYGSQSGVQKSSRDYARDNKEFSEKLKEWQRGS